MDHTGTGGTGEPVPTQRGGPLLVADKVSTGQGPILFVWWSNPSGGLVVAHHFELSLEIIAWAILLGLDLSPQNYSRQG